MIKRLLSYLPAISLIIVGLYFIFTTSPEVRMWVDDFCSSALLKNSGFFKAQISWWNGWTGRYSYIFFLDLFESIGSWVVAVLPILLLAALIVTLAPTLTYMLAFLFIVLVLINAPNIIQSFYWQTGSLNYTIPFVTFNLIIFLLFFAKRKSSFVLAFVLAFIGSGFSEPFAFSMATILLFAALVLKGERKRIAIFGLLGTVVSLIVMSFAPGNAARGMSVTKPESLMFILKSTILGTKWYLLRLITIKPFIYSVIVLLSGVFLFGKKTDIKSKTSLIVMLLSALAVVFSTAAVIATGFYSMSITPPERTMFIAIYMIFFCILIFSFALKSYLSGRISTNHKSRIAWTGIALYVVTSVLLTKTVIADWGKIRSEVRTYSQEFDKAENLLVASKGSREVLIKNIKPVGGLDSFTDNKGWVASCLAGYYEVERVKIVE